MPASSVNIDFAKFQSHKIMANYFGVSNSKFRKMLLETLPDRPLREKISPREIKELLKQYS